MQLTQGPDAEFSTAIDLSLEDNIPAVIGLAVSGGGDSVAMVRLASEWAKTAVVRLKAVTIDHGLRSESAGEAEGVRVLCESLGISHDIVQWQDWDGKGNLQDAARLARKRLIADWALKNKVGTVALGHTMDDQAETFLMRLARGSGVDGLAGMAATSVFGDIRWVRPLLGFRRQDLRDFLMERGIDWVDDPSNDDMKYDRIKARKALSELAGLGITAKGLSDTASRMMSTRRHLEVETRKTAETIAEVSQTGDVIFADGRLIEQTGEMQFRLLSHAVKWVSGAAYRPRAGSLRKCLDALGDGQPSTLSGCCITTDKGGPVRVFREFNAVSGLIAGKAELWDGRWYLNCPAAPETATIRALGEDGLRQCPDWRGQGQPRNSLISSPALFDDAELIAAPLAGFGPECAIHLKNGPEAFFWSMITH